MVKAGEKECRENQPTRKGRWEEKRRRRRNEKMQRGKNKEKRERDPPFREWPAADLPGGNLFFAGVDRQARELRSLST